MGAMKEIYQDAVELLDVGEDSYINQMRRLHGASLEVVLNTGIGYLQECLKQNYDVEYVCSVCSKKLNSEFGKKNEL